MSRLVVVILLVFVAALVSACGVDGKPERPEKPAPQGSTVTGSATVGVSF